MDQFGTVMDANCMKDLDCITVCPTDALRYGVTTPPIFRSWIAPRRLKKQYDFSWGEDILMAGVFIAALPVIRGLYDAVSFLLALALTGLLSYMSVLAVRLVCQQRVSVSQFELKAAGRLTNHGRLFSVLVVALAAFAVHSAWVHYHTFKGERAFAQLQDRSADFNANTVETVPAAGSVAATPATLLADQGLLTDPPSAATHN